MGSDFIIRRAKTEDLENILKLNFELYKKEYKEFDKTLSLKWTYSKEGKKFFRDAIVKSNNFVEVIKIKNKIVGYLNGGIAKQLLWRKKAKYAYLGSIFIEKKIRGRGFGVKLVKNFINWCRKNKVDYLSVSASAKNSLGINFYKKCGFKSQDITLQIKI